MKTKSEIKSEIELMESFSLMYDSGIMTIEGFDDSAIDSEGYKAQLKVKLAKLAFSIETLKWVLGENDEIEF